MGIRPRASKDPWNNPRICSWPLQFKEVTFVSKMPKQRHPNKRILSREIHFEFQLGAHNAHNVSNFKCLRECRLRMQN